jgi:hypothetical protein
MCVGPVRLTVVFVVVLCVVGHEARGQAVSAGPGIVVYLEDMPTCRRMCAAGPSAGHARISARRHSHRLGNVPRPANDADATVLGVHAVDTLT